MFLECSQHVRHIQDIVNKMANGLFCALKGLPFQEEVGRKHLNRQNRVRGKFKCYEGANDRLRQRIIKRWTALDKL